MNEQYTIQPTAELPTQPMTPPPVHGDSIFWTIVAIALLAKVIVGGDSNNKPRK